MTDTVADILERAADLLSKPGAWTQGAYARGRSGRAVNTRKSAVCFCVLGAINAADGYQHVSSDSLRAQSILARSLRKSSIRQVAEWNDASCRTQGEVVTKLRMAAKFARARRQS